MTWVAVVLVPIILLYTAGVTGKCSVVSPKKILNVTPTSVLSKELKMWYFAWILGTLLPVRLG